MSSCIITVKNSNWSRREVILYQHTDGHPNSFLLPLVDSLRDIYTEFKEHGDTDWFLDPGRVAGLLIVRSVPVTTEEMRSLLKSLPANSRSRLESTLFLGLPTLLPDAVKLSECNYEYSITLQEKLEEEEKFFGYSIEVYKLQNKRRLSTIMTNLENFISIRNPIVQEIE